MPVGEFLYDVCLITERRYLQRQPQNLYISNIFEDEDLLRNALENKGVSCVRVSRDDPDFDWSSVKIALFRTTWDYFERLDEFMNWLEATRKLTRFINPEELILWNLDKAYLWDLAAKGVSIPPGMYFQKQSTIDLIRICESSKWEEFIIKPAISGTARHTYHFSKTNYSEILPVFESLLEQESMILQEFQSSVLQEGELSLVMLEGKFSHAVRKRAKAGDFRVQDDFGGSLHEYEPDQEEITIAEKAINACPVLPVYARVDLIRDKENCLCVSELELIEPELWFRRHPSAAERMAEQILEEVKKYEA
jgi:glutathione synthase/RimK-type ligase-like ATP-grasp enzyme